MTAPLNGRELLYNAFIKDPEKCRKEIKVIQGKAETEKQNRTDASGIYTPPKNIALAGIRLLYVQQLSNAIFEGDPNKRAALMRYLQDKLKKKPSELPLPECWTRLFDKIVDPAKGMKSLQTKQAAKAPQVAPSAPQAKQDAAQPAQLSPGPQAVAKAPPVAPPAPQAKQVATQPVQNPASPAAAKVPPVAPAAPPIKQAPALPAKQPPAPPAAAKAPPVAPPARLQAKQAPAPAQRVAANPAQLPPVPPMRQPVAAAQNQLTLNHLQQALANIGAPNQAAPQPQQVQARAQANAPAPLLAAQLPQAVAAANAPAAPAQANVQKPKAAAQTKQKSSGFVGFLKRCGNVIVSIVTYPFRLLKMLFTSNKK